MSGGGLALSVRPAVLPPGAGGVVVPSPLQASCKEGSWPEEEMDLAVLGGLKQCTLFHPFCHKDFLFASSMLVHDNVIPGHSYKQSNVFILYDQALLYFITTVGRSVWSYIYKDFNKSHNVPILIDEHVLRNHVMCYPCRVSL